jgi:hypothetical protein
MPASGPRAPLSSSFPPDGRLFLSFSLSAGLLIEPSLPELGVEAGALDFSLEPTKSPVEAFIVLYDHFQTDHTPFRVLSE